MDEDGHIPNKFAVGFINNYQSLKNDPRSIHERPIDDSSWRWFGPTPSSRPSRIQATSMKERRIWTTNTTQWAAPIFFNHIYILIQRG